MDVTWDFTRRGIDATKAISDFFQARISAADSYSRNFARRHDWSVSSKYGYSINELFKSFVKFITSVSEITINFHKLVKEHIDPPLGDLQRELAKFSKSSHLLINECSNDFQNLQEKMHKLMSDVEGTRQKIANVKIKLSELEPSKSNSKDKSKKHGQKKSILPTFGFKKSRTQLNNDLKALEKRLKQDESNRDALKAQLQQKTKYKEVLYSKVLTDFLRHEEFRINTIRYIMNVYAKIHELRLAIVIVFCCIFCDIFCFVFGCILTGK